MKDFTLKDNTVSAVNQMIKSTELYYLGEKKENCKKIYVIGNSITRHGPKEDIGWNRDWGMAASSPDKDYVHVLYSMLENAGLTPWFLVRQGANWEFDFENYDFTEKYKEDKKFGADIIVFRLGENVHDLTEEKMPAFIEKATALLRFLSNGSTKFVFTTCFWEYKNLDDCVKKISSSFNSPLVLLGDLGHDEKMRSQEDFWHEGVKGHPGDLGMKTIAERIFNEIINL
ncbi:MAG: SGNH/GDSL hydrolase family protein [Clostridia bacterium]|nr:SGNH/GDSL hydrolase family protein [Clostridia bacterium]